MKCGLREAANDRLLQTKESRSSLNIFVWVNRRIELRQHLAIIVSKVNHNSFELIDICIDKKDIIICSSFGNDKSGFNSSKIHNLILIS